MRTKNLIKIIITTLLLFCLSACTKNIRPLTASDYEGSNHNSIMLSAILGGIIGETFAGEEGGKAGTLLGMALSVAVAEEKKQRETDEPYFKE